MPTIEKCSQRNVKKACMRTMKHAVLISNDNIISWYLKLYTGDIVAPVYCGVCVQE